MPTDNTIYKLRAMGFETKYSVAAAVTGVDDCLSLSEGSLLCACGFDELDLFTELFNFFLTQVHGGPIACMLMTLHVREFIDF